MSGEGDEVARGIPGEEDLGTWEFEIFIRFLFVFVSSFFFLFFLNSGCVFRKKEKDLPMAFPAAHATKFIVTATLFLVWPATFRESKLMPRPWAAQKDKTM